MPTVNFYLENRKDKKTGDIKQQNVPILCHFHFENTKMVINTGQKVDRKDWIKERKTNKGAIVKVQRVKRQASGSMNINARLEKMAKRLDEAYWSIREESGMVNKEDIRAAISNQNTAQKELSELIEEFMNARRKYYTYESWKKIKSALKKFELYEAYKGQKILLERVNQRFIDQFRSYCIDVLGHSNNTISKCLGFFKTLMRWSFDQGYHSNEFFKDIKKQEQPGKVITLDWNELMAIWNLELEKPGDQICRDGFLLQCFTSLRYSDLRNLKRSDLVNDVIDITNIKTRDLNQIPLNDYSREIVNRYWDTPGESLIPVMSNQKMNKKLKKLGKLAGIDQKITLVHFYGKERKETVVHKYEVLSTHIGRKTFITTALILGMPTELVMSISNHKDYKTFKRYVNIANEAKRNAMDKYFRKSEK